MPRSGLLTICVTFIAVGAIYGLIRWKVSEWSPQDNARNCEERVRKRIDPAALQSWATNLLFVHPPSVTNYSPRRSEIPVELLNVWRHGPPRISLRESLNGEQEHVYIFWGSGSL